MSLATPNYQLMVHNQYPLAIVLIPHQLTDQLNQNHGFQHWHRLLNLTIWEPSTASHCEPSTIKTIISHQLPTILAFINQHQLHHRGSHSCHTCRCSRHPTPPPSFGGYDLASESLQDRSPRRALPSCEGREMGSDGWWLG